MSANVETMFYTRETPWHGLGVRVEESPSSIEALSYAGLHWEVVQKDIKTKDDIIIPGYKANVRSTDQKILGVVTDRYQVVQNRDAFAFTDNLLGEGISYETAGSLQGGRKVWLLAKLREPITIAGDEICPYLVFFNSHDGTAAIKVAITPIRVVCNNTLNLALNTAKRCWSMNHTGDINNKLKEAEETLFYTEKYLSCLKSEAERMHFIKLNEGKVIDLIDELFPTPMDSSELQMKNINNLKDDVKMRYFDAPDLRDLNHNAYRFINAISDFATHAKPLRETKSYKENLFSKTVEGNALIDRAYSLLKTA